MNHLEIKDLMVFYENALAINNVSLSVEKGGITGVFGANSAGKSTLMYTASGVILDVQKKERMRGGQRLTILGSILFEGREIRHLEASERARLGMVLCPERRRIFKESSVMENLRIGGVLATRAQAARTLDYVFRIFPKLKLLRKREGGFLSGGEQQMLAIGRALMAQPKLLLLDEPLLGLSPLMETMLTEAVENINQETGISVVLAEQYARPVLPLIDFGYVMENGGVVVMGRAQELMDNPDVKSAYFGM
ncbi:High-affinity branched-chain amino acid transport ATP-binding protein BraG [uncultured Desulfatiglans sp.]|uniref:High-affinity branched-chain amino acid transport ATP-binding protein BraG n=1 Tax=Uncultured Desulfatiglans sp. TaxID=1748965 RepID=A0A653A080_UNCDX|nr:High-affinity branched-chain amino acid transport ATP-binding protein BraG [uncultured Desulfatiglans sp.]